MERDDDLGQYHRNCHDSEYEGAEAIAPKKQTLLARVRALFLECGSMTDEELMTRYEERYGPIYKNSLEPRRYELVRDGWLLKSSERRPGKSGVGRIVWIVNPARLQLLERAGSPYIARDLRADDPRQQPELF